MSWFVYMLKCADNTLYTGITKDIEHRIGMHEQGTGAKYTKGRGPFELLYQEPLATMSEALKREAQIKALSKAAKLNLSILASASPRK